MDRAQSPREEIHGTGGERGPDSGLALSLTASSEGCKVGGLISQC